MAREPRELVTIPDTDPRILYAAVSPGVTEYAFNFPFWKTEDVEVWTRATGLPEWTQRFDIAVTPIGGFPQTGYPSGLITFAAPQENIEVAIVRRGTFDRLSNLLPGQAIDIFAVNRDLNRAVGLNQTLRLAMHGVLRSTELEDLTTSSGFELPSRVVRANQMLGFDNAGRPRLDSRDDFIDELSSEALNDYLAQYWTSQYWNYAGTGAQSVFAMAGAQSDIDANYFVTVDGVRLEPTVDYVIDNEEITFTAPPALNAVIVIQSVMGFGNVREIRYVATIADMLALPTPVSGQPVLVGEPGQGGMFHYDLSEALTNNGGTILDGWVRQYTGPLDVAWFGAVLDGTTNDTPALQAAVNVGPAVRISGTAYLGAVVDLPDNTRLYGPGRLVQLAGGNYPMVRAVGRSNIALSGLHFDGRNLEYSQLAQGPGLYFEGCTNVRLFECQVTGFLAPVPWLTNKVRPIHFENCEQVWIGDSRFIQSGYRGLSFIGGSNIFIGRNYFFGGRNTAITVRGTIATPIRHITIANNICQDHNSANEAFDGVIDVYEESEHVVVDGNIITRFGNNTEKAGAADGCGIRVTDTRNFTITNNVIVKPATPGVYNYSAAGIIVTTRIGGNGSRYGVIANNNVIFADGHADYGIRVSGDAMHTITLSDNNVRGQGTAVFDIAALQSDCDNCRIMNNVFDGFNAGIRLQNMQHGIINDNIFANGTRAITTLSTGTYGRMIVAGNEFRNITERAIVMIDAVIGSLQLVNNLSTDNDVLCRGFAVSTTHLVCQGNRLDAHSTWGIDVLNSVDAMISGNKLDGCLLRLNAGNVRAFIHGNKVSNGTITILGATNVDNAVAYNDLRNVASVVDTGTTSLLVGNLT